MKTKELLRDPGFRNGFFVTPPNDPHGMPPALMCWPGASTPDWLLRQWNSTSDVSWSWMQEYGQNGFRWDTESKSIRWTDSKSPTLSLHMDGIAEYGGKLRAPDASWAHLLVEQELHVPERISNLQKLVFGCQTQVENFHSAPDLRLENSHTAQWQAFVTVQNRETGHPGYGDFLWFGIPFVDTRYALPKRHAAGDTAGSGKFIYTPSGMEYFRDRDAFPFGEWVLLEVDILPLINQGLDAAWKAGFLPKSRDRRLFAISSLNLGWELTGPLVVGASLRNFSLQAVSRA
ncbi:MAG: hypothetical protein RLZZ78_1736 [Armatimonadota bacterium]